VRIEKNDTSTRKNSQIQAGIHDREIKQLFKTTEKTCRQLFREACGD